MEPCGLILHSTHFWNESGDASTDGSLKTGLRVCPPAKNAPKHCLRSAAGHSLRSSLRARVEEIAALVRDFQSNAAGFLYSPDCMAEREGFEPPVRFPVLQFSRLAPSTTRPPLRLLQFYYRVHFMAEAMPAKPRIANRTFGAGLDCAVMQPRHSLLASV